MALRKRVGVALGGGVVRGMAHIGVLSALGEAGVQVDLVAGSSAGAIIGAGYCAGLSIEQLQMLAGQMSWFRLLRLVWPARGLVSFAPMERWLVRNFGDLTFDRMKIPFAAVTTDLITGESVVLRQGRLAAAVTASCSVAGLVVPTEMDGRLLCDGNYSNSVPVSVARDMGAEYVIGVDIFQPAIRRRLGALGYGLAGLELLIQRSGGGMQAADCLISPELSGATYLRFSQRDKLYELGKQAAQSQMARILMDLS